MDQRTEISQMHNISEQDDAVQTIGMQIRLMAQDVRARTRQLRAEMAEHLARAESERQRLQRNLAVPG